MSPFPTGATTAPQKRQVVFSLRALESILLSVLSALEAEMVFIRNLIGGLLAELEDDIDRDRFKRLLHYSRRLAAFQNRAKLVTCYLLPYCRVIEGLTGVNAVQVQEALEEVLEQGWFFMVVNIRGAAKPAIQMKILLPCTLRIRKMVLLGL